MTAQHVAEADADSAFGRPALANPRRLSFLPALEGLRGVAHFVVLADHIGMFLVVPLHLWLVPGGYVAMDMFFSLSGFLITALLLAELAKYGTIKFKRFFKRRAIRLFPALVVVLIGHFFLALAYDYDMWRELRTALFALTFTANYQHSLGIEPPWDLNIVWSLGVEGQFYLMWPFTLWLIYKFAKTPWGVVLGMVPLVAASALIRIWEYNRWGWNLTYYRTESRIDAFVLGGIVAVLWCFDLIPRRLAPIVGLIGSVIMVVTLWTGRFEQPYEYSWLGILLKVAGAAVIVACLFNDTVIAKVLAPRLFRLSGRVSYSFYLVHMQVYMWVLLQHPEWSPLHRVVVALTGTLILGSLCYMIAERPILTRPAVKQRRMARQASSE